MEEAIARLRAALAGRYDVERELGAGGMATVYLARDLKYEVIEGGHGAGANAEERAHTTAMGYVYFTRRLMDKSPAIVP